VNTPWRPQAFTAYDRAVIEKYHRQLEGSASATLQCQTGRPHRILVVDDEPLILRLNTQMLFGAGYNVDAAADGADAWDTLQLNCYDLMITDNNMPKVSGVELIQKVHVARMTLPVIMATGALPTEEFARYPHLQPAAIMLKPYTSEEFLGMVREVLRATDGTREQTALQPYWQNQPLADGLQLQ
jgi:DNA-binding response OmpR family regulator